MPKALVVDDSEENVYFLQTLLAGSEFEVLDADPRRIKKLRVHWQLKRGPASSEESETPPETQPRQEPDAGAADDARTKAA